MYGENHTYSLNKNTLFPKIAHDQAPNPLKFLDTYKIDEGKARFKKLDFWVEYIGYMS